MTTIEALEQEPFLWDYLPRVEKPIVLYGMGNGADAILDRCAALGIPVAGVFASDEFVRGQEFRGYKVKTYKEMKAELGSFVILIAFASERPENSPAFLPPGPGTGNLRPPSAPVRG